MTELARGTHLLVQLAKRGDAPDRTDRERVRAALAAALATGPAATGPAATGPSATGPAPPAAPAGRGRRPTAAWLWVAAISMSTAAAAAAAATVAHQSVRTPALVLVTSAPISGALDDGPAPAVAPVPTEARTLTEAAASVAAPAPRAPASLRGPAAAPPYTLGAEAALLRRARNAVSDGRLDVAAASLAEHRARMPHGALAEDREALQAVVDCRLGTDPRRATGFAERFPDSALVPRVERACGLVAP